jgi:hypothetical protein
MAALDMQGAVAPRGGFTGEYADRRKPPASAPTDQSRMADALVPPDHRPGVDGVAQRVLRDLPRRRCHNVRI